MLTSQIYHSYCYIPLCFTSHKMIYRYSLRWFRLCLVFSVGIMLFILKWCVHALFPEISWVLPPWASIQNGRLSLFRGTSMGSHVKLQISDPKALGGTLFVTLTRSRFLGGNITSSAQIQSGQTASKKDVPIFEKAECQPFPNVNPLQIRSRMQKICG